MADVVRRTLRRRNVLQPCEQQAVVGSVRGARAGEPGGVNTWSAVQRIDDQAAVFREHPLAEVPRLRGRFERRVFGERVTGFGNAQGVREIRQRSQPELRRIQQLGKLSQLLSIVRADNEETCSCHCRFNGRRSGLARKHRPPKRGVPSLAGAARRK